MKNYSTKMLFQEPSFLLPRLSTQFAQSNIFLTTSASHSALLTLTFYEYKKIKRVLFLAATQPTY